MALTPDCCGRAVKANVVEVELGEKLGGQLIGLEDSIRELQDNVSALFESVGPVLLPDGPVACNGGEDKAYDPPACPVGERIRTFAFAVRHANQTVLDIRRRLAVG